MTQARYEVSVVGIVPDEDLADMGAVPLIPRQVSTRLYGITDQAALYGLLARLRALGIEVLEVRRVPDSAEEGPRSRHEDVVDKAEHESAHETEDEQS